MKKIKLTLVLLAISIAAMAQNGLYAEYLFNNGSLTPSFGSVNPIGHNITFAEDRFGCPNNAIEFDASSSSYLDLGDNFDQHFAATDGSLAFSFWFKHKDYTKFNQLFLVKYSTGHCSEDQREFAIRYGLNGNLDILYTTSLIYSDYRGVEGSTLLNDELWHHCVINYNGSIDSGDGLDRVELFIDNVQETTNLWGSLGALGNIQDGTAHFAAGIATNSSGSLCEDPGSDQRFDGYLDDIRLYNQTLTITAIDSLFNETSPCANANVSESDNLISFEVYPNPTVGNLQIKFEKIEGTAVIRIADSKGTIVRAIQTEEKINYLDLNDLDNGLYLVTLDSNGFQATKKIIISKK